MKPSIFFLFALFLWSAVPAFAQFEYAHEAFSLADMNVKGKVKRIVETKVSTDRKGRVDDDEKKFRYTYEFDESGRLTQKTVVELGYIESENYVYRYEYANGKLNKVHVKVRYSQPYIRLFNYGSNAILVKNESGDIKEQFSLSNNRIIESKYFGSSKTLYRYRDLFEYNATGQVSKKTYMDDAETYRKFSTHETYAYNKNGDRDRKEKFNQEKKLDWITDYDYSYDKNKNWTKCEEMFYSPGEAKDERVYTRYERTFEYY